MAEARVDNRSSRLVAQVGEALEKGLRNENQDMIMTSGFPPGAAKGSQCEALVVGVLDGHGSSGLICASTTRDLFRDELAKPDNPVMKAMLSDSDQLVPEFVKLFHETQSRILCLSEDKLTKVSARFSGTTVVIALVAKTRICVANVGDSDAVLGSLAAGSDSSDSFAVTDKLLNVRHQLTLEAERNRVVEAGGRVETQRGRNGNPMEGPLRVWLKEIQTPGLMVSRSIGDLVCHDIGVSATPDVVVHEITDLDTVLILGSDGLWEFVKPEEAVNFTEDFLDPVQAAHGLAQMALSRQTMRNADNVSVLVVFLEAAETRAERMAKRPDLKDVIAKRDEEVFAFERIVQDKERERTAKHNPATPAMPNPNGSIMYGEPNANASVVAGSILDTGSEYEKDQAKKNRLPGVEGSDSDSVAGKKTSKACVIS